MITQLLSEPAVSARRLAVGVAADQREVGGCRLAERRFAQRDLRLGDRNPEAAQRGLYAVAGSESELSVITARDGRVVYRRVPDPTRASLIKRMYDLVEAGHTTGDVARAFNVEGTKTVRGKDWTPRRVGETVRNPYHGGWITA